MGNNSIRYVDPGCFVTAYARETNAWQIYSLKSKGSVIIEEMKEAIISVIYSENPYTPIGVVGGVDG